MEAIVRRSAGLLDTKIDADAASLLARSSRGTPRVVNRLLRRMRDFAQYAGRSVISLAVVKDGLERLEIDALGLEKQDRDILKVIIERYNGGPVGAETLAISIGESVETLEDYYEPYLIQAGLIQRTPRGRMATGFAYEHLGIVKPGGNSPEPGGLLF
jgi:Holliday junction DNA helicase RuvB